MRQEKQNVLRMRQGQTCAADQREIEAAWTLVDYLFPADREPVWSGSVSHLRGAVLRKTA